MQPVVYCLGRGKGTFRRLLDRRYRTTVYMQPLRPGRDDADCCVAARAAMCSTQPDAAGTGAVPQQAAAADQHQAAADVVRVARPLLCLASGHQRQPQIPSQTKTRHRQIAVATATPARYCFWWVGAHAPRALAGSSRVYLSAPTQLLKARFLIGAGFSHDFGTT